jgi:HEAT repeat protein
MIMERKPAAKVADHKLDEARGCYLPIGTPPRNMSGVRATVPNRQNRADATAITKPTSATLGFWNRWATRLKLAHETLDRAVPAARSKDLRQRYLAALALGSIGHTDAQKYLRPMLDDPDNYVRLAAATAIIQLKPPG